MSVRVTLRGRLGNNLFQYCLGRILAERHELALECIDESKAHPGPALQLSGPFTLATLTDHFPNAPLIIPGRSYSSPIETYTLDHAWDGQTFPFERAMKDSSPRHIRLDGFFQRYEYFVDNTDDIRRWFATAAPPQSLPAIDREDVVLSIRRGPDFGYLRWVLPTTYYLRALELVRPKGRVFICGTGISEDLISSFGAYRPILYEGAPIHQFHFLQKFSTVILANSTFCWWAAFLSQARLIIAPRATLGTGYAFSGFDGVDLHMRHGRYQEIDVVQFAGFTVSAISRIVGASLFISSNRIIIGRSAVPATAIVRHDALIPVLRCLAQHAELPYTDLVQEFGDEDHKVFMPELLSRGIMQLAYRYPEP